MKKKVVGHRSLHLPLQIGIATGVLCLLGFGVLLKFLLLPSTQIAIKEWLFYKRNPDARKNTLQPRNIAATTPPASYKKHSVFSQSLQNNTKELLFESANASWALYPLLYIHGTMYYVDNRDIYRYSLGTKQREIVYTLPDKKKTIFTILPGGSDTFYIVESPDTTYLPAGMPDYYYIKSFSLADRSTSELAKVKPRLYQAPIGVIRTDAAVFVILNGGDGGVGYTDVERVDASGQKNVMKYHSGSGSPTPQFISILSDKTTILSAALLPNAAPPNGENAACRYDVLYSFDPVTSHVLPLYDLKRIDGCIRSISYDPDSNTAVIKTDSALYQLDIASKQIIHTLVTKSSFSTSLFFGNAISYDYEFATKEIVISDFIRQTNKRVSYTEKNFPRIIADHNGSLITVD